MSIGATWAGTHTFGAKDIIEATSIAQVEDVLGSTTGPVRALGTRHSLQ
ncbi:hypothetical protein [Demequina litorisediminis]|uniref:Uncharacterized protein n=1 Tax=Demequina litorisediminis TaxID=1849022 RepID=A0ABQ6IDZ7_9MICO|nr:hypothetical protein [Demequina litorisediminis]GMA36084.1 hypothetical protein GCM10025876_22880 [Demequina litorisediminis]